MQRTPGALSRAAILFAIACCSSFAHGQSFDTSVPGSGTGAPSADDMLKKVDLLVQQNEQLERHNHELMDQISVMRRMLAEQAHAPHTEALDAAVAKETSSDISHPVSNDISPTSTTMAASTNVISTSSVNAATQTGNAVAGQEQSKTWGNYTPNFGYKVANTEFGDMSVSIYSYVRYLNQKNLAPTYTNYFGVTSTLQQRQDVQINKVQIKFLGWMLNPKLRYFLYAWTSNASQGLGAQVVLAGNLSYRFSNYFTLAGGIRSLPGTRSVEGNFPFWLGVDTRLITDEFFRPSYTSGIWATGDISKTLSYQAMIGNNLSTLGVSAAQIDNAFNTISSMLAWEPTTGEFGIGFGDFENHQKLATRIAGHYTTSTETAQEQPGQDTFENTQIRLSDGSVIFTPNLFRPGTTVNSLRYQMVSGDGGFKYHGWAFEAEGFWRWLNNFEGTGTAGLPTRYDTGYQFQLSMMPIQKKLQLYSGGSHIFGQYGNPYDARIGTNWFPYKNRVLRWNTELLYLFRSPVGYTSVPFPLGGKGLVFDTTVELAF
jgi:hypothetical protein